MIALCKDSRKNVVKSLRTSLFREHLGLMHHAPQVVNLHDPCTESFWHGLWNKVSRENTEIYRKVFACLPCNSVTTFDQLRFVDRGGGTGGRSLAEEDPEAAKLMLEEVRGLLVHYPLKFLSGETLIPNTDKVPGHTFYDKVYH